MFAPKPVDHYPSKRAAVAAMRRNGVSLRHAEWAVGWNTKDRRVVNLPKEVVDMIEPHARSRGQSTAKLIAALLFAAAEDGLIDALMEDR